MLKAIFIFLLFLLAQLGTALGVALWMNWHNIEQGRAFDLLLSSSAAPWQIATITIIFHALLCVSLWLFRLTSEHCIGRFRYGRPRLGTTLVVSFLLCSVGVSLCLSPLELNDSGMIESFRRIVSHPLGVVMAVFTAPLVEELIFRDGILRHLYGARFPQWIAVFVSALSFAIVHGNVAQSLPAFVLGLLLALLYLRTGDLRLCLPAHMLNNALAVCELHYPTLEARLHRLPSSLILGAGVLVLGVGAFLFWRSYRVGLSASKRQRHRRQ